MKRFFLVLLLPMLLAGCDAKEAWETLGQVAHQQAETPGMREISLELPGEAALETGNGEDGTAVYVCRGYELVVQSLPGGDLNGTVKAMSGFGPEGVTLVETACGDYARYDWVWSAVSEEGELVCRGTVLDDGAYHYCLCAMAHAEDAGALQGQWNEVFASFGLAETAQEE